MVPKLVFPDMTKSHNNVHPPEERMLSPTQNARNDYPLPGWPGELTGYIAAFSASATSVTLPIRPPYSSVVMEEVMWV